MIDRLISCIARILALEYTNHMLFFGICFQIWKKKEQNERAPSG
jgi:hypothetical protein